MRRTRRQHAALAACARGAYFGFPALATMEGEDQPDAFEAGKIAERFARKSVDENDPRLRRITGGGALYDTGLVRCIDALAIGRCDEGDGRAQQRMHHRWFRLPRHFLSACLRFAFTITLRPARPQ